MRINKGIVAWAVAAMVAVVPAQMALAGGDSYDHHKHQPKKHHHKHHHKHHDGFHGGDHSQNHNDFSRDNNGRCQTAEEGGLFGHLLDDVNVIAVDAEVCNGDDVAHIGDDNSST